MRIEINLKIILIFVLFLFFNNIYTYIIFGISILIHELAHMFVGIIIGGKPKRMEINPFGVSLEFYYYGNDNFITKIIFYLIGPISNFIIALVFMNCNNYEFYKQEIIYTNIGICIFNLIPILPLDGGKILKEILRQIIGIEKTNKFLIIFSKFFLLVISFAYSILIIKIKNIMILFLLIYLWYLYLIEEKKYYIYKKVNDSIRKLI